MFYVYILKSPKHKRYYIGYTHNIRKRLERHNKENTKWSSRYKPWTIIYTEKYNSKSEALKRERQIKSYKGGKAFEILISQGGGVDNRSSL